MGFQSGALYELKTLLQDQVDARHCCQCWWCNQHCDDILKCEGCRVSRFCGRNHQRMAWKRPFGILRSRTTKSALSWICVGHWVNICLSMTSMKPFQSNSAWPMRMRSRLSCLFQIWQSMSNITTVDQMANLTLQTCLDSTLYVRFYECDRTVGM